MATNLITVKYHERSDKQIHMEHNHLHAAGGSESKMKFSTSLVESPPSKPPRRRYSEQLSSPYFGNHPSRKLDEETQKGNSKSKSFTGKTACLSLPASLSASISNEHDDPLNVQLPTLDLPGDHKPSKEKKFLESLKFPDSFKKKVFHSNKFCNKEKLQSFNQDINSDKLSKKQCDSFVPFVDKLFRNSCKDEPSMPCTVINHCQKVIHKKFRRRHSCPQIYDHTHHNDPALFSVDILKDNALELDLEKCSDNVSHSAKKSNTFLDNVYSCSCCKKNYCIMQEIQNVKEINGKLWQHLCSFQICHEKKKTHDECADVSVSDLLSSIYYAQKAKDSAMDERLKIVLEERDAALQEIDDLIYALTRSCDYSGSEKEFDEGKKELLGEVGCTGNLPRLLKCQRMLLARLNNLKSFKQDTMSCELGQVTKERNDALEKVAELENDVKNMKIGFDLWHSDNKHYETILFEALNQTLHQRDTALSKIDNGIDIGNVKRRLDSFQQNPSSVEPHSKTLESLKGDQSMNSSDCKQQQSFKTSDDVTMLKEEILLLNKALESEKKKRELYEERCYRLERLIHVLRKKINGQDVGVHV